jgi:MsuE subfamily FMN reductase
MKLLGLSGSPAKNAASRTLNAVKQAVQFAHQQDSTLITETINVRDLNIELCDGRDPAMYEGDTKSLIQKIVAADALILGTPVYRGSYTGILKNVFDVIPNDALVGKPVGIVVTGSTQHHYLTIEHEIKPLLGFFHAHALPGGVYLIPEHYRDRVLIDEGALERLQQLSTAIVQFVKHLPNDRNLLAGASGPEIPWESRLKGSNKL